MESNQTHLDRSSIQLDGSHTSAKKGGEAVGYQGRRASNATNLGQVIETPQEGGAS